MRASRLALVILTVGLLSAVPAEAKDVVIQMRNRGAQGTMVFEPAYVTAAVGDTIRFVPTDPGHNAEPIPGMLPTGVTLPAGKFSQEYLVKVAKPGLYGFRCLPHYGLGMVALVKVGKGTPDNLIAVQSVKTPPLAAKRLSPLIAQAR